MKKLLSGITVLAVLIMLGTTVFAGSSAPKSLCYEWAGSYIPTTMMALKNLGTIQTANGPVKQYSVHGTHIYDGTYPPATFTGTATFISGILRFNTTSIVRTSGNPGSVPGQYWQQLDEGTFNPVTGTGNLSSTLVNIIGGTVTIAFSYNLPVTAVNCRDYSIDFTTAVSSMASQEGRGIMGMLKVE